MAKRKRRKARKAKRSPKLGRTLVELTGLSRGRIRLPAAKQSGRVGPLDLFGKKKRKKAQAKKAKAKQEKTTSKAAAGLSSASVRNILGMGIEMGKARRKSRKRKAGKKKMSAGYKKMYGLGLPGRRGVARRFGSTGISEFGQADVAKAMRAGAFMGAYQYLATKSGMKAAAGVIGGNQLGLVAARAAQKFIFTDAALDKQTDFMSNMVGDLVGAGLAWEIGKRVDKNIAAWAAIGAATRFISQYIGTQIESKLLPEGWGGVKGLGSWYEYDYEGGGVGQVRIPDDAALGQQRYAEDEGFYGLSQEDTLFG